MKVKTILVSQPEPASDKSPYSRLKEKHKLKIDFRPFIHVEGLKSRDVRKQKIDFSVFNSIIFTSRNSVDHFFRLSKEMRFKVPDSTKYFCQSHVFCSTQFFFEGGSAIRLGKKNTVLAYAPLQCRSCRLHGRLLHLQELKNPVKLSRTIESTCFLAQFTDTLK